MSCSLYRLTFPNGKCYIGISKNPALRWRGHGALSRRQKRTPLHKAISHFGEECIRKEVLVIGPRAYIEALEVKSIALFRSMVPGGYNASPGGDISPATLPEVRAKMSAAKLKRWSGDPEYRRMMTALHIGTKQTEETKASMRVAQRLRRAKEKEERS